MYEGVSGVIYSKVQSIVPVSVRMHKMLLLFFLNFKKIVNVLVTPCSMWDLNSLTWIEPMSPAFEVWSLNHCTTREIPFTLILIRQVEVWSCPETKLMVSMTSPLLQRKFLFVPLKSASNAQDFTCQQSWAGRKELRGQGDRERKNL